LTVSGKGYLAKRKCSLGRLDRACIRSIASRMGLLSLLLLYTVFTLS
jgi:hypothetical protein